jgi:hypothetical protein
MPKLTIDDINRIESWILKKVDTLPPAKDSEYSDANLSRGIFQLMLCLLEEKRQEHYRTLLDYHSPRTVYPNPHVGAPAYPFVYPYADATASDTICATCKAQYPQHTHCIHRVQMGSTNNTGGKL